MIVVKETDLAYIAGLFDGEGCIHWFTCKGKYVYPSVHIGMTTHGGLDLVVKLFGGKLHLRLDKRPNHSPTYRWVVTNRKALTFLRAIYPWLREKSNQADKVFEFYNDIENRYCPGCGIKINDERPRDTVYCTHRCYHNQWSKKRRASIKSQIEIMQGTMARGEV